MKFAPPLLSSLFVLSLTVSVKPKAPDFNREVRPILSENCFHCHGPDSEARKANLRLDTFEGATANRKGVKAVVPGDLAASELWAHVTSSDPDEVMPPPGSNRRLTPAQKRTLRRWIESGARYEQHWAFVPPKRPDLPPSVAPRIHPIDAFVRTRLVSSPLTPAPRADRPTLIRRVALDLTGLPPTRAELHRFLADKDPQAYEKMVDRYLASERFGEHWARPWLDLARYADSNGFQADQLRDSWAWRDWVIRALNTNMPFDQFSIEQLAGDLLPKATADQKIATGFHRTVTCNVEAGVHPEENRVNQIVDRVNTTATVWLGLTMECAQCHDHKYDPISMQDYYKLFAYFNNTPLEVQNKSGKGVQFEFYGPKMSLPLSPDQWSYKSKLESEQEAIQAEIDRRFAEPEPGFSDWLVQARLEAISEPRWTVLPVMKFTSTGGEEHRILEDRSVLISGNVPGTTRYELQSEIDLKHVHAFKLEALTHPDLPGNGPGRGDEIRNNFVLNEFETHLLPGKGKPQAQKFTDAVADFSQKSWDVKGAVDGNPKSGWAISPQFSKSHWAEFFLEKPIHLASSVPIRFTLEQNFGRGRTLGCIRISARQGSATAFPPRTRDLLAKNPRQWKESERENALAAYWAQESGMVSLKKRLQKIRADLKKIQPPSTLVMVEMDKPRITHVMKRGNYLDPQEKVGPGTPSLLHPIQTQKSLPANRLTLARWLMQPENPLVARVTVNRWWAEIFGRGIVSTVEDFGTQCEPPTHPKLLDWLAVEFMESGWDRKYLLRTILTSETYQQSSRITPKHLELDPDNHTLARGSRMRLAAETIRDNALAISGLLETRMYGRPIMPFQPPGIWRTVGRNAPKWQEQEDENRWRRSIYIVYRRAAPYPSLVNFDAPDRGACTVKRPRTNTPLQALTLLNDPAYLEMALAFADRILTEGPAAVEERIRYAFELATARQVTDSEARTLFDLLKTKRPGDETTALGLIKSVRGSYKPEHANAIELAAWFYVASTMLNLDETVTKE